MDAANVLKTELLSLEGASIEQKFMLMLVDRTEACEERIKHDASARAPSHSFNICTQLTKHGAYFNMTLWQVAPQPEGTTAPEYVGCAAMARLYISPQSCSSVGVQLGGLLTAEVSKLGLPCAELFLGLHSDYQLGCLVTDLRKPVEAEGILTWSITPGVTVDHIAAALEAAWQMSMVSMSQEDQSHCEKLCSLCLEPCAVSPHRNMKELSMAQQILETCIKMFYAPPHGEARTASLSKLFTLSADRKWSSSDIKSVPSEYALNVHISKHMACVVLSSSGNLEFMRGYTSQLGYHCHNSQMYEVDDDYDF